MSRHQSAVGSPRGRAGDSCFHPMRVVELDLEEPGELRSPFGAAAPEPGGGVLALVRLRGRPVGLTTVTAPSVGGSATLYRALVESARGESSIPARNGAGPGGRPGRVRRTQEDSGTPLVSVIVCTRNREDMLPRCLDSLIRIDYPRFEIVLVDNAPQSDAVADLVRSRYAGQMRYLREPAPGLARARNRGVAGAFGDICAFTDDDAVVDPAWLDTVVAAFEADRRVACVTGMLLPAELDTEAQAVMEEYTGSSRDFEPHTWSLRGQTADPLSRISVGRFGTGANMAFRTDVLRSIGGFDPATGTGTPSRGGEDLLAFQQVLEAGYAVAYRPDAIIWHRHRRTMDALADQVFALGIGFSAYLCAAMVHRPWLLATVLRLLPVGLRRWHADRRREVRSASPEHRELLRSLTRLERRGLLYGPACYGFSLCWQRRTRAGT